MKMSSAGQYVQPYVLIPYVYITLLLRAMLGSLSGGGATQQ